MSPPPRVADGRSPTRGLEAMFERLLALARSRGAAGCRSALRAHRADGSMPCSAGEVIDGAARELRVRRTAVQFPWPRPLRKIDKPVHPASIGLVGVSATSMNFGRIILRNLMGSGYGKDRLTIIRDGETEIDGVRVRREPGGATKAKLDLLIVAVAADAVYGLVDEIIATDAAESAMLIPGGLGETATSREPAAALAARINAVNANEGGGPIFLGANCLGVVSHRAGTTPGSSRSNGCPNRQRSRNAIPSC